MTIWNDIMPALFGYPAHVMIKDAQNLSANRKLVRSYVRLSTGIISIIVGLLSHLWLPSDVTYFFSCVLHETFPGPHLLSNTLGVYINTWALSTATLWTAKQACRGLNYMAFGVTHSIYHLSASEEAKLVSKFMLNAPTLPSQQASQELRQIFKTLVRKIEHAKRLEAKNNFQCTTLLLQRDIRKDELKYVLEEFRMGHLDPYENLLVLEKINEVSARERFVQRSNSYHSLDGAKPTSEVDMSTIDRKMLIRFSHVLCQNNAPKGSGIRTLWTKNNRSKLHLD